jgi:mannose-6-phosphate isomerase-like protein (cupin superfamily)
MRPEVKQASAAVEFETTERCHIIEIANDPGDEFVSIARARVKPGVTTAWHKLDRISERYIIVSGQGLVEVDDLEPIDVLPGDVVRKNHQYWQRGSNILRGLRPSLSTNQLCQPRVEYRIFSVTKPEPDKSDL